STMFTQLNQYHVVLEVDPQFRYIDVLDVVRAVAELWVHFQHYVVLVELGEHSRDLALTERVIQSRVDGRGTHSQTGGSVTINDELSLQSVRLHVTGDVLQF